MRKAILIVMLPLLLSAVVVDLSAQTKRKPKKPKPNPFLIPYKESPCGVPVPTYEEFEQETEVKWRVAAASKEAMYFYNTQRVTCEPGGILRVWIKGTYDDAGKSISAMSRYELKCRASQLRITSQTEYYRTGTVANSRSYKNAEWDEPIPDSVGERILQAVCHKTP